ncbi:MAG: hypothetical protein CVU61_14195 [Deltaproteobacteria bacterium HGW-Deltaproteobacteria-19]|nr:MAG: hypothetical protein CVU61_14195 [Deltaproteobacteria bacterium HGW-Deltaproteobacteria-19]
MALAAAAADGPVKSYGKSYRFEQDGWIYLHIEGAPYERGMQHGFLLAPELDRVLRNIRSLTYLETGKEWDFFVQAADRLFTRRLDPEFLAEIKGIAAGAQKAGVRITWKEVLAWNGYAELTGYWWPNAMAKYRYANRIPAVSDHCSAFIAAGKATKDGKIVMAHNTWNDFQIGQFANLILDILPDRGYRIFMQSVPGYIHSKTDFFVTGAGIMGTETTIGGFGMYREKAAPAFFRVRKAMQYAWTLDDFVRTMRHRNSGGYANSWLLADTKTNEIMRFELGLEFYNVERTKDGWFIGFNAPLDPRIRNLECGNTGFADIRRHQGARQVRLTQLMRQHDGKIDTETARQILADHYDVYLKKDNPCSRTVDGHYELDDRAFMSQPGRPLPFQPRGTVDGKVMDSDMAKDMAFWARFGNSSGMPFIAEEFLKENIQWEHLRGYLDDRPSRPWSLFMAAQRNN